MNTLDYSKGDVSRAKTAQYYPGQSTTGPYYNPNLNYSGRVDQSGYDGRVYPGDASQYYLRVQNQPSQSYQQQTFYLFRYARHLATSQSLNPKLAKSEHVRFQLPQGYAYGPQMGQNVQYQGQPQVYYNQNAQYIPQPQTQPQQPYQRQFLSFRPMMANQVNQVAQSRIPLDSRQPYHEYDFKIFCPACHQQYYNSQVEEHIEKHYLYNTDRFKLSNLTNTKAEVTQLQPSQQLLTNQSRFYYPLVEPQEFQCKQLDEVNYMNKYKLQHQELNRRQTNVKVKSQATQFAKPPLQIKSENTDIYNCFDNIFSSNNTFNVNDLTKSNTIIAKKRQLDDWEKLRSHKEGYKIKTN